MKRVLNNPVNVPASQTSAPIHTWGLNESARESCRVDIFTGLVAGTVDLTLEQSTDFSLWTTAKAATVGASTNKTVSFTASSSSITATSHALTVGQWIVFTSTGALPAPFVAGQPYIVAEVVDANHIRVKTSTIESTQFTIAQAAGTGTHTASLIQQVSITIQDTVTADQSVTPLQARVRLTATTAGGETVQVIRIYTTA